MSWASPPGIFANKNSIDLCSGLPHWYMSYILNNAVSNLKINLGANSSRDCSNNLEGDPYTHYQIELEPRQTFACGNSTCADRAEWDSATKQPILDNECTALEYTIGRIKAVAAELSTQKYRHPKQRVFPDTNKQLGIHCPCWPQGTLEMIHRHRPSNWPSACKVREIQKLGFHIIPVINPKSESSDIQWRFSFAAAQKLLTRSLTSHQRETYILFKIICSTNLNICGFMHRRHFRTIFFWTCEKIPQHCWSPDTVFSNLMHLIDQLKLSLVHHNVPNYFMPMINMIEHVPVPMIQVALKQIVALRKATLVLIMRSIDVAHQETRPTTVFLTNCLAHSLGKKHHIDKTNILQTLAIDVSELMLQYYIDGHIIEAYSALNMFARLLALIRFGYDTGLQRVDFSYSDPVSQRYYDAGVSMGWWLLKQGPLILRFPDKRSSVATFQSADQNNHEYGRNLGFLEKYFVYIRLADICLKRAIDCRSGGEKEYFILEATNNYSEAYEVLFEIKYLTHLDKYTEICRHAYFLYNTGMKTNSIKLLETEIWYKDRITEKDLPCECVSGLFTIDNKMENTVDPYISMLLLCHDDRTLQILNLHFAYYILVRSYIEMGLTEKATQVVRVFEKSYKECMSHLAPVELQTVYVGSLPLLAYCHLYMKKYVNSMDLFEDIKTKTRYYTRVADKMLNFIHSVWHQPQISDSHLKTFKPGLFVNN